MCCFYKWSINLMFYMAKHLFIRSGSTIYMFQDILKELRVITDELKVTNNYLRQIEENLRVPNMIEWAKFRKSLIKKPS